MAKSRAEKADFCSITRCCAALLVVSLGACAAVAGTLVEALASVLSDPFFAMAAFAPGLGPSTTTAEIRAREDEIDNPERRTMDGYGPRDSDPEIPLRAILAALPDAALTLDGDGNVTFCNDLAVELFPRLTLGMPLTMFLRNPDFTSAIETATHTSRPITVHISERVPVARSLEATVSRLDTGCPSARLLINFRDLTEREKIEEMRADFVANASHELRTPLASLIGYIETLQGSARNDETARERFLAVMQTQAQRMSRLVDDLLSLTRVEMRAHLPPTGRADLNEVAAYVVKSLEPLAAQQSAEIKLAKLDRAAYVRADREEIVQAVQNLVHNALKYARDDGRVAISVSVNRIATEMAAGEPARLEISVTDNGRGIAHHHIPRLVERFYRVSVKSSRAKGGTGLGLAIVKHIMQRHGGDLTISSKLGAGSTFTLSFSELRWP